MGAPWKDSDSRRDRLEPVKRVLARIFGDGENPLAWGFTLLVVRSVRVRVHLLFAVYLLAELIFTLPGHKEGFVFVAPRLAAVLAIVVGRELVHGFVCRRHGGEIDELMLWPVGSLNPIEPRGGFRAGLVVALSPIAAQIGFGAPVAAALWVVTGSGAALVFNPFSPASAIPGLTLGDGTTPWWLVALWSVYVVNLVIVLINLCPMPPLDAGRVLGLWLARTRDDLSARAVLALVGVVTATIVGVLGIVFEDTAVLLGVAIVCGLFSSMERQRLRFLRTASPGPGAFEPPMDRDERAGKERGPDPSEVDRVLAKVSESGMGSLSRRERRLLKDATRSSRESQRPG